MNFYMDNELLYERSNFYMNNELLYEQSIFCITFISSLSLILHFLIFLNYFLILSLGLPNFFANFSGPKKHISSFKITVIIHTYKYNSHWYL